MPRANGITRQEILTFLKHQGTMTAEELHQKLGISQVAVRQHLVALEAEGMINVGVERHGLGRPSHRYSLTTRGDETFPRQYDTFANTLLDALREWQGEEAVQQLLDLRRERLHTAFLHHLKDKPLSSRLQELARLLDEEGFMAEIHPDGTTTYILRKQNCAVCAVARRYPDACCHRETDFFESLLGNVTVTHERSIHNGDPLCEFRIEAKQ